jgi:RNA polymerase sigma-70 factor (family 1)
MPPKILFFTRLTIVSTFVTETTSTIVNDCHMENAPSFLLTASSNELLDRIAAGDQSAFRQVYGDYYKRLFQFSLAIVKIRESAEEIVEDVFVRIWQRKASLPSIGNLRVYLYTATKNTSLNYLSKKAKECIAEPFDHIHIGLSASGVTPEELLITAEMYRKLQSAVEALPPRCKIIFKLVREDGLRYKEIAEILNISVNTIDVHMAIAVKRIAAALGAELGFPLLRKAARR